MDKPNIILEDIADTMDDFQQIKGIGPSIAQALHESGIQSYADLAEYTPEELVNLLSPKVGFVTIQRIEKDDWLTQARALAALHNQGIHATGNSPETDISSQATFSSYTEGKPKNHIEHRQEDWREIADFFVSFGYAPDSTGVMSIYTRVHHSQEDRFDQWQGVAIQKLIDWMMEQARLPLENEAQEPSEGRSFQIEGRPPRIESEELAQIDLKDLWVSQVQVPEMVDGIPQSGLIQVESKITLSGPDALSLTYERIPFNVQVYLVDTENHQSECVSIHTGHLTPEELSYQIQQEFPTPGQGRYQINVIGQLSSPSAAGELQTIFSYLQGPILRVGAV